MTESQQQYEVGDELPIEGEVKKTTVTATIPPKSASRISSDGAPESTKKSWLRVNLHPMLLIAQFLGLGFVLLNYGWPLDAWTHAALSIFTATLILVGLTGGSRFYLFKHLVTGLFLLSLIVPLESHWIQDVHGGREGTVVLPWQLRFGRSGENTERLERYLGTLEPKWRHRSIRSMAMSRWNDGNERVNSRSLIYSESLERILLFLPDSAARQQVLSCLTDSSNLLSVHQGMLLAALDLKGYPNGYDRETWWDAHRWIFVSEPSGVRAAYLTQGWTRRCDSYILSDSRGVYQEQFDLLASQVRAAKYQEEGTSWGGDPAFVEGVFYLERVKSEGSQLSRYPLTSLEKEFAGKSVVWWR